MKSGSIGKGKSKEEDLYKIILQIRPLFRSLHNAVEDDLTGSGITVAMRAVMEILSSEKPQTVPEIARILGLERQSVQRVVDELIRKKLAERQDNPAHARSYLLQISGAGKRAFAAIRSREQENLRLVAKSLSHSEIQAGLRVVGHMAACFSNFQKLKEERDKS